MTTNAIESLTRERCAVAERAVKVYDLGTTEVENAGGCSGRPPGTELHRRFFLAADGRRALDQVHRESASVRAHFVVRFKNARSAKVFESCAIIAHRGLFGISGNGG